MRPTWKWRLLLLASIVIGAVLLATPVGADWEHPVDAPISDPFRPPASRFGAGNRGLEYGTSGGEFVLAVDAGVVVFAGTVGLERHVVVDHGDGLRSTYAFVASIDVVRGQRVVQGQRVATAATALHLTARLGSTYVDPMLLMAGAEVVVRLRPGGQAPATSRQLSPGRAVLDAAGDLSLTAQLLTIAEAADAWKHSECTEDGAAVSAPTGSAAPSERVLVQVGGLGSSSGEASIGGLDHRALGYVEDNVVAFSYAGGCSPTAFGGTTSSLAADVGGQTYGPTDTLQSIEVSANYLADAVTDIAAARPGQPIDLAAHSLGGVVARRAIEILEARGALAPVDMVITIGSPHGGADLATGAVAISGDTVVGSLADLVGGDLAEFRVADSVLDIAEAGGGGLVDPAPPPDDVRVLAIAGSTDLVVPGAHATWSGATNVVVATSIAGAPDVHAGLPSMPEVQREVELALAGAAPRCVSLSTVVGSAVQAAGVSVVEDAITLVAGISRWVF